MTNLRQVFRNKGDGSLVISDEGNFVLCAYSFTQLDPTLEWTVNHYNNSNIIAVQVYIDDKLIIPEDIFIESPDKFRVFFAEPQAGILNFIVYKSGDIDDCGLAEVTPDPSVTPTPTPSLTFLASPTPTPSLTPTLTPTISLTPTFTPTISITPSITPTVSLSADVTPTITSTPTPTVTASNTVTPTVTPSLTFGYVTVTATPTQTATNTATPVPPSFTPTPTQTGTPTLTPSITPSNPLAFSEIDNLADENQNFWSIAYSPALGIYAAQAIGNVNGDIFTSNDVEAWTNQPSSSSRLDFNSGGRIIWADAPISKFLAFDPTGSGYDYSSDGTTWTSDTVFVGSHPGVYAAAYSSDLGLVVVLPASGNPRANLTTDGISWTNPSVSGLNTGQEWRDMIWVGGAHQIFVAVCGQGSGSRIVTSANGTAWSGPTGGTFSGSENLSSIAYSFTLGLFVATSANTGTIYTSPDATTWTERLPTETQIALNAPINRVIWGSGEFVMVVGDNDANYQSTDGINWTPISPGPDLGNSNLMDIVHNTAADVYVAVSQSGGGSFGATIQYIGSLIPVTPTPTPAPTPGDNDGFTGAAGADSMVEAFPFAAPFTNSVVVGSFAASPGTSTEHHGSAGASSFTDGYVMGGYIPALSPSPTFGNYISAIDRFPFSAPFSGGTNIGDIRSGGGTNEYAFNTGHQSSTDGYTGLGFDGAYFNSYHSFPFSSPFAGDNDVGSLSTNSFSTGASSSTDGYVAGGLSPAFSPSNVIRIQTFPFSAPFYFTFGSIGNLNFKAWGAAGMSSPTDAFISGGSALGVAKGNSVQSFPFSSPFTFSTTVGSLRLSGTGNLYGTGSQSATTGYHAGSYTNTATNAKQVLSFPFSAPFSSATDVGDLVTALAEYHAGAGWTS